MSAVPPSSRTAPVSDEGCVEFYVGNTQVSISSGTLRLHKNWLSYPSTWQVALLSVPSYLPLPDLIRFLNEWNNKDCAMRVIRTDPSGMYYGLLLLLDSVASAHQFYSQFNQRPFSVLKPSDVCCVEFVDSVHFRDAPAPLSPRSLGSSSGPAAAFDEASTCPICQDSLRKGEKREGVVTTLCNHEYHSKCLVESPHSVCAVCRFNYEPSIRTKCCVCASDDDLWMCTRCGHTGCGRTKGSHAEMHFRENPDHNIATSEGFKGFASQEEADEALARQVGGKSIEQTSLNSKLEAIGTEYNYVLVSLLDSQKLYYEGIIEGLKAKPGAGQGGAAATHSAADAAQKRRLEENREKMENLRLQLQETDSLFQSTKAQQDEYLKKIASLEAERDHLKAQVAELEETNRDLCTHLATGRTLSENPELVGAQIVVQPPSPKPRQNRGGAAQGRR